MDVGRQCPSSPAARSGRAASVPGRIHPPGWASPGGASPRDAEPAALAECGAAASGVRAGDGEEDGRADSRVGGEVSPGSAFGFEVHRADAMGTSPAAGP